MIKENELRIGDYVYGTNNTISTILELMVFNAELRNNESYEYLEYEDIEPIPITEEILLKCGFEHSKMGLVYGNFYVKDINEDDEFYLRPSFEGGYYWGFNDNQELKDVKNILYFHQLQNLYFALTGEELTVNL